MRRFLAPRRFSALASAALLALAFSLSACDSAGSGPNYSRALLTDYVQEAMPFANGQGQTWDATDGPDAVFILMDEEDREIARSQTYPDLTRADLPLQWSFLPRPEITEFSASYYIALYDQDGDYLTPVATTDRFRLQEFADAGFATTYTFESASDTLASRVEIRWEE